MESRKKSEFAMNLNQPLFLTSHFLSSPEMPVLFIEQTLLTMSPPPPPFSQSRVKARPTALKGNLPTHCCCSCCCLCSFFVVVAAAVVVVAAASAVVVV